jgi:hypothetical protein
MEEKPAVSILHGRITTILKDMDTVEYDLRSMNPQLRKRVFIRLGTQLHRKRRELQRLDKELGISGSKENKVDLADAWRTLNSLEASMADLFDECLSLLEASSIREQTAIGRFCTIADSLIDEIISQTDLNWGSFTLPAPSEYYVSSARAIRVRYPGMSVWDLPVVAHELAHFVGPSLTIDRAGRTVHPFEQLLADVRQQEEHLQESERNGPWMMEIFGDVFAAYTLGLAYLFTCVRLRFDPVTASTPSAYYPPANTRVAIVVHALERFMEHSGIMFTSIGDMVHTAREYWSEAVNSANSLQTPLIHLDERQFGLLNEMYELLTDNLPFARYSSWPRARQFTDKIEILLKEERQPDEIYERLNENDIADLTGADVLNMAWFIRVRRGESILPVIENIARMLLDSIVNRTSQTAMTASVVPIEDSGAKEEKAAVQRGGSLKRTRMGDGPK